MKFPRSDFFHRKPIHTSFRPLQRYHPASVPSSHCMILKVGHQEKSVTYSVFPRLIKECCFTGRVLKSAAHLSSTSTSTRKAEEKQYVQLVQKAFCTDFDEKE